MAAVDSGRIRVPAQLEGAGPFIRGVSAEMAAELDRLRARVVALKDTWREGTAQEKYQQYQAEWDLAAKGLFGPGGSLEIIAGVMDQIWQNYCLVEATNTRGWQNTGGGR